MVGVLGGGLGGEGAAPCVAEIGGGDGSAVAPAGVGAQVEGVDAGVRGDFPGLGDAGDDLAVLVEGGEALEEGVGDAALGLAGDDRGVEGFRLGAVEEDEVCAVAGALAGGEKEGDQQEKRGWPEEAEGVRGFGGRVYRCTNADFWGVLQRSSKGGIFNAETRRRREGGGGGMEGCGTEGTKGFMFKCKFMFKSCLRQIRP